MMRPEASVHGSSMTQSVVENIPPGGPDLTLLRHSELVLPHLSLVWVFPEVATVTDELQ